MEISPTGGGKRLSCGGYTGDHGTIASRVQVVDFRLKRCCAAMAGGLEQALGLGFNCV